MTNIRYILLPLCLLILLLMMEVKVVAAAEVTLRAPLEVDGSHITLADLFNGVTPEDADKEVVAAPSPGKSITLHPSWIATAAQHFGYVWQPAMAPKAVQLSRRSQTITADDIARAITDHLKQKTGEMDLDVELMNRNTQVDVATTVTPFVQVEDAKVDHLRKTLSATIRIAIDATRETSLNITGQLHHIVQVPVLNNRKSNGDVISTTDLSFRPLRQEDVNPQVILDADKIVGMTPRRFVMAEAPIRDGDLSAPVLVNKNELVTVILNSGAMHLTMQGKALEEGSRGEVIRILNTQSKQTIEGQVTGRNEVRIRSVSLGAPKIAENQYINH